jgi:hypothetical protein
MASQVDVANRALSKIGDARIISLGDDSEAAILLNSMFDVMRDAELRAHPWNFSIKRASLAALVSTPAYGFPNEYQIPGDCLRLLMVGEAYVGSSQSNYRSMPEQVYQIEGLKILTHYTAPLKVKYIKQVTNVGEWDPLFVEYFATVLAHECCERLAQSSSLKETLRRDKAEMFMRAIRADAIENPPELIADDSWVLARL